MRLQRSGLSNPIQECRKQLVEARATPLVLESFSQAAQFFHPSFHVSWLESEE